MAACLQLKVPQSDLHFFHQTDPLFFALMYTIQSILNKIHVFMFQMCACSDPHLLTLLLLSVLTCFFSMFVTMYQTCKILLCFQHPFLLLFFVTKTTQTVTSHGDILDLLHILLFINTQSACVYNYPCDINDYHSLSWNFKNVYGGQEPRRNRVIVPARQATQAGGIHSLESIPGPNKHFKVRALDFELPS